MKVSAYDSSSISMLFSSLGNNGGTDLLGINYSDYATIRNGSYGKLMKSYYSLDSDSSKKSSSSNSANKATSSSTSKDSAKTLANIESASEELVDTAKELYSKSSNKLFSKDSKGNYDVDAIFGKVQSFVEDYNSLLSASAKSDVNRITNGADAMQRVTKGNENLLEKIGITVDSDNGALSVDKQQFYDSDMEQVKKLFYGTGSYAYRVATQASLVNSYAQTETVKANTYGRAGTYNYNYNSGSIYSDYF